MCRCNPIQIIEEKQKASLIDPHVCHRAGNPIFLLQFLLHPFVKRLTLACPGGKVKHDWQRLQGILLCTREQFSREFEKECRFACTSFTQDEQFSSSLFV